MLPFGKKKESVNYGEAFWASTLGINLVVSSAAGLAIGYFLDKWLKTSPILLIIGFLFGTFAGFWEIFKEAKKAERNEAKRNSENKGES